MSLFSRTKTYYFPLLLIVSIIAGGLFGVYYKQYTPYLKPFGDIFLNLILTTIVPLIFFSVASAIASTESIAKMRRILFYMMLVFVVTGFIAAICSLFVVLFFPLGVGVSMPFTLSEKPKALHFSEQFAGIFTVSDFSLLFSHQKILALVVFSILVGFAVLSSEEKAKKFVPFLQAGEAVFMRIFSFIMYYAPIGFFAYFAVLVSHLGSQLLENYVRVAGVYYIFSSIYFVVMYTIYAYFSGKKSAVKLFWKEVFLPMITALGTCSSAASIPANLAAAKKMNISAEIYETQIPIGAMIHKDGSTIGGMMKIAFLFGIFHLDFTSLPVFLTAILISVLVGTVMGAIPSGGMLGELLILSVYGFPPSALMMIAAISIIIDPLATMLNVTGNTVSCMITQSLVEEKPIRSLL